MFNLSRWIMFSSALLAPCFSDATYDLDDYEGDYISRAYSTGGSGFINSGGTLGITTTTTFQVGESISSVSQFSIDKRGHGFVHFLSYTLFASYGSFASVIQTTNGSPTFKFQLQITDPQNGAGTITFTNYPVSGENQQFDFVSSKDDGRVRKMYLNLFNVTPVTDLVAAVQAIVERQ